ncbi:MAG: arylsulfatase [Bacteroidota bacterium]
MKKPLFLILFFVYGTLLIAQQKPNIVFIYSDDLGYGDLSCYGATKIKTPNIDALARKGIRFTNAHASSATCTPSRYSLLTGQYAWRKKGTGIAPGNAALIIPANKKTLAGMLQNAGYNTAAIGKWHLGLGPAGGPDWNHEIKPGPEEIGFNYSFIIPATADRVPCVFVENHLVVNLDPNDTIVVSYKEPIENELTGKDHPELLKLNPSHGHDQAIVDSISRIGYMSGGKSALWKDEDIADVLTGKAVNYIVQNKNQPFFLYFATHDIHVPRAPGERFAGKSGLASRGDVIMQLDDCVGRISKTLDSLQLTNNTIIIFSSDNGPVVDDGYKDNAVAQLNGHTPAGILKGGKYSNFEAGTRVPLILQWPGKINAGKKSAALFSQVDVYGSLAALTNQVLSIDEAPDSFNMLDVLLGRSEKDRDYIVEHAGSLSLVKKSWKYIEPGDGPAYDKNTNIQLGNAGQPQLYNLDKDIREQNNLATKYPATVKSMARLLNNIKNQTATRLP